MDTAQPLSPDEQVAQQIAAQLQAGHLLTAAQVQEVRAGLANGTLKAADWRLLAEKAIEAEARHAVAR